VASGPSSADTQSVAILGMPRSGTSLTARVLNVLGVDLGPEEHMLEPTPGSNPKGYWEQREINALNDAILQTFGGSFESPPDLPPGWENDPVLDPLRDRARRLIDDYFGGSPLWGWKDPRNSLTQPFWGQLVPDTAFVLCVRAPEDVASSWQRHDSVHALDWHELLGVWLQYNSAALRHTAGAPRLVVLHDRLLANPGSEVRRLAGFLAELGVQHSVVTLEEAVASVDSQLVHHSTTMLESIEDARVPVETRALYGLLEGLADPNAPADRAAVVEALAGGLWQRYREGRSAAASPQAPAEPAPPAPAPPARSPRAAATRIVHRLRAARHAPEPQPAPSPPLEIRASLDSPADGALLNRKDVWVWGRILFPRAATARVLVALNGAPGVRARLGLPRADVAADPELAHGHRDAPVAGFELLVPPNSLPGDADEVEIAVTAMATDGSSVDLPARRVRLESPQRGTDQDDARAHELRDRVLTAGHTGSAIAPDTGRLLAFSHALDRESAREQLLGLLGTLGERGVPTAVAAAMDRSLHDRFEAVGAKVHMTSAVPLQTPELYESRLAELAAWLTAQAPRGIVAQGIDSFPLVDLAERLAIPNVWFLYEAADLEVSWIRRGLAGPEYEYARDRAARALRQAGALIFPSEPTRAFYEPYCDRGRSFVVPAAVDSEAIARFRADFDRDAARDALGIDPSATVLFCPGRIVQAGWKIVVLQALAELRERHPEAYLVLPGANDEAREQVGLFRDYAAGAGLADAVRILPASGGYYWYGMADVVVVDTDPQDVPSAALEAMAFEDLVVASKLGGLEETVEHGVNGWLWEPNDLGQLIDLLDAALSATREERQAIGARAAARVRERHEPGARADAVERTLAAAPMLPSP
jgi:glycosyltransferase involved in cell wall biosynthesis